MRAIRTATKVVPAKEETALAVIQEDEEEEDDVIKVEAPVVKKKSKKQLKIRTKKEKNDLPKRKLKRLALLYGAILVLFVGIPVLINELFLEEVDLEFGSSELTVDAECDLYLSQASKFKASVNLEASKSSWQRTNAYLRVSSSEDCALRLKVPLNARLTLRTTKGIEGSGLTVGSLAIQKAKRLQLSDFSAEEIQAQTQHSITMKRIHSRVVSLMSADADIAFTSTQDFRIKYNSSYTACLASTNLTNVTSNAEEIALCETDCHITTNVTAVTLKGSVYATRLVQDTPKAQHQRLTLDPESAFYLSDTNRWRNLKANADIIQVIEFTGPGQDVGKFVHTSNPAYIGVRPWVVDVLSLGFLKPRLRSFSGRVTPAQCPFVDGWQDSSELVGAVTQLIKTQADIQAPEEVFLNANNAPDDQSITYTQTDDTFQVTRTTVSGMALLAIAFSLTLAALAGFLAFRFSYMKLQHWNERIDTRDYERLRFQKLYTQYLKGELSQLKLSDGSDAALTFSAAKTLTHHEAAEIPKHRRDLFELIDLYIMRRAEQQQNSLITFLKLVTKPTGRVTSIPLQTFREVYERWAISNDQPIESLVESNHLFEKYANYSLLNISSSSTDAFTRVRFKTAWEIEAFKRAGDSLRPLPSESSIAAFVRIKLVISGLDSDYISKQDMVLKYFNFCETQKISSPLLMTKNLMHDECSIHLKRLEIPTLVPNSMHNSPSQPVIQLEHFQNSKDAKDTYDLSLILIYILAFLLIPSFFALLAYRGEASKHPVTNRRVCRHFGSFLLRGDTCVQEHMSFIHRFMSIFTLTVWVLSLFQCTIHILIFEPHKKQIETTSGTVKALHRITSSMHIFLITVCVSSIIAYLTLIIIWFALGAVLNPQQNSPLGVIAVVLASFIAGMHAVYEAATKQLRDGLKEILYLRIIKRANRIAGHIPHHTTTSLAVANEAVLTRLRTKIRAHPALSKLNPSILTRISVDDNKSSTLCDEIAKSAEVSRHLVAYAYAAESRDEAQLLHTAEQIAADHAIQTPSRLATSLTLLGASNNEAAVKSLFNAFCSIQSENNSAFYAPVGSINASLVASSVFVASRPVAFVKAFQLEKFSAFRCLLAKLEHDDDQLYDAARSIISNVLTDRPKISAACRAWLRLKEAKLVLSTWEDEENDYLALSDCLGWGEADMSSSVRGALPRFALARTSGRKTLMMTVMPHLQTFVNEHLNAPNISIEAMTGLAAVKYGTDVNVRSFARECGLDESIASSIAFMLSCQQGDRGAAIFTLLTHLDLRSNLSFLADATGGKTNAAGNKAKADPTRVLGMMAIAQKNMNEEMLKFVKGLANDFAILHLGGAEPGIAPLDKKVDALTALIEMLCASTPETVLESKARLMKLAGNQEILDAAATYALLFALFPQEETYYTEFKAALKSTPSIKEHSGLRALSNASESEKEHNDNESDSDDDDAAELCDGPPTPLYAATVIRAGTPETDGACELENEFLELLSSAEAVPMMVIKRILEQCFPTRSIINSDTALAAVKSLLYLVHTKSLSSSAFGAIAQEIAALLHTDPETTKSILETLRGPANAYKVSMSPVDWLKSSGAGADPSVIAATELFAQKWLKAQAISEYAVQCVSKLAKLSGLPLFFLQALALGGSVIKSPELMQSLCQFLTENLEYSDEAVDQVKGFFLHDLEATARLERSVKLDGLLNAVALFGEGDINTKLQHCASLLSSKSEKEAAAMSALVAFSGHYVGALPGVSVKENSFIQTKEDTCTAVIRPRDVLAKACNLPTALVGALNEAQSAASKRDGLKGCLMQMLGELYANDMPYAGLPMTEAQMRALLSIATGTGDGLEEAAQVCKLDPRLVEGLVLVSSARAVDKDLVSMNKLKHNPGLVKLFAWTGLPLDQASALVALAKQDYDAPEAISQALALAQGPVPALLIKAMAVSAQVACATHPPTYASGFAKLHDCMGPVAHIFGVRDRRAAEVAASLMRICQGDASPLRDLPRLGIGLRDAPFLCAITLLGSPVPACFEEGSDPKWDATRHAHSATRNLAYVLKLNEKHAFSLVEAGRGLKRGLRLLGPSLASALEKIMVKASTRGVNRGLSTRSNASSVLSSVCPEDDTDKDAMDAETLPLFALVLYIVHGYADSDSDRVSRLAAKCSEFANDDKTIRKFLRKEAKRDSRQRRHGFLLEALSAQLGGMKPEICHFMLALATPDSKKSIEAVLDCYLANSTSAVMSDRDFRQTARLLLALANGDEPQICKCGYDANLLRTLSFKVHKDTSPHTNSNGTLSELHPLIFLSRFAHRDPRCFDNVAATRLYPNVGVLKAILMIIAHDWQCLSEDGLFETLMKAMRLTETKAAAALIGIAVRGCLVKANKIVASPHAESVRQACVATEAIGKRTHLGCRRHELLEHMTTITSFLGGSSGVYASSFMAGCSEDKVFISDALTPLSMKMKLSPDLATNIVMVMQGDMDALVQVCCTAMKVDLAEAPEVAWDLLDGTMSVSDIMSATSPSIAHKLHRWSIDSVESDDWHAWMILLTLVDAIRVTLVLVGVIPMILLNYCIAACTSVLFALDLCLRISGAGVDALAQDTMLAFEAFLVFLDLVIYVIEFSIKNGSIAQVLRLLRIVRLLRIGRTVARVANVDLTEEFVENRQRKNDTAARWISARCFAALASIASQDAVENTENRKVLEAKLFPSSNSRINEDDIDLVSAAQAVGRCNTSEFKSTMGLAGNKDEDLLCMLDICVSLWNRSMTAFISHSESNAPVMVLDRIFTERLFGKAHCAHGFAVAAGCACSMLTFVSEQLAMIAQEAERHKGKSLSKIRYPPFGPRLLLAIKRDNVLERENDKLQIKYKYRKPVQNLISAMSSNASNAPEMNDDQLVLFLSLFQNLPRQAFPEAYARVFPSTPRDLLAKVETVLTPFSEVRLADVRSVAERISSETTVLPELLVFLSNSTRHMEYPFQVLKETAECDKVPLIEAMLSSSKIRELVELVVPYIIEKAVPYTAIEAWNQSRENLIDFVYGVAMARAASTPEALAESAEILATSLHCSARHILGFLSLGRNWTAGVVELISDISDADETQAASLESVLALALPMSGLYEEAEDEALFVEEAAVDKENETEELLTARQLFSLADENASGTLVFDEYAYLLKICGFDLTEASMLQSFTTDDSQGSRLVDFDDFERGLYRRIDIMSTSILRVVRLDEITLLKTCFIALCVLLVLFLFIFAGIEALSGASTLGTVVNSILPLIAGFAANSFNLLNKLNLPDILSSIQTDIDVAIAASLLGAAAGYLANKADSCTGLFANARAGHFHTILKQSG